MRLPIYLDYMATTPVDPRVAVKMQHYLTMDGVFGNPASPHFYGRAAQEAVDVARAQVAQLINAAPDEIIWTSGATEANNLALKGAAQFYQRQGKHIITCATEHKAVLAPLRYLETLGFEVTYLAPQSNGLLDLAQLEEALERRRDTILVSIMHVNNEIGVIQDIAAIGKLTRARGVLLHVDAAQSVGKIAVDVHACNVDLLSCTAHKFYGPKGIGALYVRGKPRLHLVPQLHGGEQERGLRSGTLAVHQIVGMGEACALARAEMTVICSCGSSSSWCALARAEMTVRTGFKPAQRWCAGNSGSGEGAGDGEGSGEGSGSGGSDGARILALRQHFWHSIKDLSQVQPGVQLQLHGDLERRIAGNLNVSFIGIDAELLLAALSDIAISHGAACSSLTMEPSHVLLALGVPRAVAASAVRFSFGRFTTREEVDYAAQHVCDVVRKLIGNSGHD